jgi:hypothetical protein
MDLHLHTPGSSDYQEPGVSYLDILQRAEQRDLNLVAFTDHNTVRGYREMLEEIEQLNLLRELKRIEADEQYRLDEYERLLSSMLVLPGFEFTATFGFHILGIFSPETTIRELEHILLSLHISPETLDVGDSNVGASSDVLTAYAAINQAGGLAIAAHANSSHGVAMRGLGFGGQTKIAYTQDPNLHTLEVTDLERRGRGSTARFFDGSKPEYPRPMRCIQGSDAHRLDVDPKNRKSLGVGSRVTEILLPELSYEALYNALAGSDMARTRPYRKGKTAFDHIKSARREGETIVQSFHDSMTRRGGRLYAIAADVCAFANTTGGTVYVGLSADQKAKPVGVGNISQSIETLRSEISSKITPQLEVSIDSQKTEGVTVIRMQVPRGASPPYAIDDNKIYVRDDEGETNLAVRDEIVQMVTRSQPPVEGEAQEAAPEAAHDAPDAPDSGVPDMPRTGVEIVDTEERNGTLYHRVRDLRNGNIVQNVTRQSARRLWHYAITEIEDAPVDPRKVEWRGDIGIWKRYQHARRTRYDLVQKEDGGIRVYYGVTEDGIHGLWRDLVGESDEE